MESRHTRWLIVLCVRTASAIAVTAETPAAQDLDALQLHEERVAENLDAETVAELDALLDDPVDLNDGELERLRALPWLDAPAIEGLRRARPLSGWEDVVKRAGWNEETVRLSRPFVRFAPRRQAPWFQGELASRVLRSRRELWLSASTSTLSFASRRVTDDVRRGFFVLRDRRARLVAGDFKSTAAQGLLWWTHAEAQRAGATPLRRARGMTGSTALDTAHLVRGAGIEWRGGHGALEVAAGKHTDAALQAAAAQVDIGNARLRLAAVRRASRLWSSAAFEYAHDGSASAVEIVHGKRGVAWAVAGRRRHGCWGAGARLEVTVPDTSPLSSGRGQNRLALGEVGWRRGALNVLAALSQNTNIDSDGTHISDLDRQASAAWGRDGLGFDCRLQERRTETAVLDVEAPDEARQRLLRRLLLRVRWQRPAWRAWLEHRTVELLRNDASNEWGGSWQAGVERGSSWHRLVLASTVFRVPHGHAAPVVPEPGIGTGSVRLFGDGVRLAARLRLEVVGMTGQLRAAWQSTQQRAQEVFLEAALELRRR